MNLDICTDLISKVVVEVICKALEHTPLDKWYQHIHFSDSCKTFTKGFVSGLCVYGGVLILTVFHRRIFKDVEKEYKKLEREYRIHQELMDKCSTYSDNMMEKHCKLRLKLEEAKEKLPKNKATDNVIELKRVNK